MAVFVCNWDECVIIIDRNNNLWTQINYKCFIDNAGEDWKKQAPAVSELICTALSHVFIKIIWSAMGVIIINYLFKKMFALFERKLGKNVMTIVRTNMWKYLHDNVYTYSVE